MDNDKTTPVFISGLLPKECYSNANEFAQDLAKVFRVPSDTYSVIQGAKGKDGLSVTGPSGPIGLKGADATLYTRKFDIETGVTFVSFPIFTGWDSASYQIHHKGMRNATGGALVYNPSAGIVGAGPAVRLAPGNTLILVYFIFGGGITSTPDANHVLHVTSTTPI